MRRLILGLCNSIIFWIAGTSIASANPTIERGEYSQPQAKTPQEENKLEKSKLEKYKLTVTPLSEQLFSQPTAKHLGRGEVFINLDVRLFFLPDLVPGGVDDDDTAANYNTGFSWGITDGLQLTLQFQHVDSSSPAKQGGFISERTEDNEASLELKQRIWQNEAQTHALSGVFAASWGTRGFMFTEIDTINTEDEVEIEINNRDIFVSLAFPFTGTVGDRWQFNIAPTIAFFGDESAVFFHRLPNDDDSSFGTTFGLAGGVSYQVNSRLAIFGDTFIPFTGNNSINRNSGEPDKAIAYNVGLRYLVNPRLAIDAFASNTFASFAPLSLTADRDLVAFGTKLVFMPDFISANRRYRDRFNAKTTEDITPITTDGLGFFDGGTLSSGQFMFNLQGGSQGILTSLRYGLLKDLEAGIYLDYISGEVDESEQGISAKIRLLNQAENSPFTLSLASTIGITNEPFANFFTNNRDEFERRGFAKEIPIFTPGGDNIEEGIELIVTASLPMQYQFERDTAIWFTPVLGYVQRLGVEIVGFNLGGSMSLSEEFSLLAEVGANFTTNGNAFIGNELEDRIPWTVAVRWTPLSLFKREASPTNSDPRLELYLTNRVGSSTWHQLRVRDQNETAIGVGLSWPF